MIIFFFSLLFQFSKIEIVSKPFLINQTNTNCTLLTVPPHRLLAEKLTSRVLEIFFKFKMLINTLPFMIYIYISVQVSIDSFISIKKNNSLS